MKLAAICLTATAMLALTACGGSSPASPVSTPQATTAETSAAAPSPSGPPQCADLFVEGQPIDFAAAKGGCTDPDGGLHSASFFRCNDGTHLWQLDAKTGAPNGWGFDDQPYVVVAGDTASDKDYAKAYAKCNG